jgi:hypothetical protein
MRTCRGISDTSLNAPHPLHSYTTAPSDQRNSTTPCCGFAQVLQIGVFKGKLRSRALDFSREKKASRIGLPLQ